ncbi:GTP-binding protein [Bradyrhizobium sp.]|nr:hypothetical protein [Bradyrhizobium sp.]MBV9985375.1 hypothetical protein [Bradyrhizobium sp.]
MIQFSNRCLCCGIHQRSRATLADRAERGKARGIASIGVIVETTGLADPAPDCRCRAKRLWKSTKRTWRNW